MVTTVGVGDGGGGGSKGGGAAAAGEPALVNVAKLEARASTLWNVPNILTMARVIAIPVSRGGDGHGHGRGLERDTERRERLVGVFIMHFCALARPRQAAGAGV